MTKSDISRNKFMLEDKLAVKGYDWWWHSFTAINNRTGEKKPFFIEFYITNPETNPDNIQFGRLNQIPSYTMINVGCWGKNKVQLHNFYKINETHIDKNKLEVKVKNNYLSETRTYGEVIVNDADSHPEYMCDNGRIRWDLKINKIIPFNVGYGASSLFRKLNAFEMFWHAEGMKTEYEGTIELNDELYIVDKDNCYGYADKNWGSNFTSPWVWISSNNLYSNTNNQKLENSVFNVGGGKPVVFNHPLNRKLLIDMVYEGKEYNYNFALFWKLIKTDFNFTETDTEVIWTVTSKNYHSRVEIECTCKKEDMLHINYESPDGKKLHNKLWNGGNGYGRIRLFERKFLREELVDDIVFENAGCEYGEYEKKG